MPDPDASNPAVKTKPLPATRPHRLWRWVFRTVAFACVLLGLAAIGIHLALPSIVRQQVHDALARAGYPNATFNVDGASVFGVRLSNIKAGKEGELTVSTANVGYRPLRVIFGRISHVSIENAAILIDLAGRPEAEHPSTKPFDFFAATSFQGIPIWRVDLANCAVTLRRGEDSDERVTVKLDGWLWREWPDRLRISLKLLGQSGSPAFVDGSLDFEKRWIDLTGRGQDLRLTGLLAIMPRSVTASLDQADGRVDLRSHFRFAEGKPAAEVSMELRDGKFITSEDVGDLRAEGTTASLDFTSFFPPQAKPGQHISVKKLLIGPAEKSEDQNDRAPLPNQLDDVQLDFGLDADQRLVITTLRSNWAGGALFTEGPVPIDLSKRSATVTLVAQHIGLDTFLKLVSQGKLSGQGALSGRISLALNGNEVTFGNGEVRSDGPGMLNFGEQVSDIAGEIAQKDPRLKGQEQQLVAALTHFKYDEIAFVFQRTQTGLSIETKISGRGTQGLKTPLDLTVHFQGLEQLLNSYLRATQRVK